MTRPPADPRVVRNDWSAVPVPELGRWRPVLPVSVLIPAYQCQASLELTLASLAQQTYPAELLEVVVVDDGSEPPLELPKIRPARCRMLRSDGAAGWGRAHALHLGATAADGEVLHWLDADMVVEPGHVAAQARWHHRLRYAVTLGWKRFVDVAPADPGWPSPDQVAEAGAAGRVARLFAGLPSGGHDYVERQIARTDRLRDADHLAFLVHVGATAALRRELYEAAGGLRTELRLGEDTELGYRLAQAGAVFVPEPQEPAWHLGRSHMMRHEQVLRRYNQPFLADLMPQPRWLRRVGGSGWAVPLVTAVVEVGDAPLERVRAAVDAILASDQPDLRVVLVGPWHTLSAGRVSPLEDPQRELRLIAASYRSDPRVRLAGQPPETGFPSPYLLRVPVGCGLARPAVRRLVEHADRHRLGLVRVPVGAGAGSAGPERAGAEVELWRTAAVARAGWVRRADEPLAEVVGEVYGTGTVSAGTVGVVDLSGLSAAELAGGPVATAAPAGRWLPGSVEVAGVRSLARAAWVVARLAARRARSRLRRRTPD